MIKDGRLFDCVPGVYRTAVSGEVILGCGRDGERWQYDRQSVCNLEA